MRREPIIAPDVYKPRAVHALKIGDWVYTTGIVGYTPEPDHKLAPDFESQCRQLFRNLERVLAAAGANLQHIVRNDNYLAKPEYMNKFFEIRSEFTKDPPGKPAQRVGFLGVVTFPNPNLLVEVEVIALIDS